MASFDEVVKAFVATHRIPAASFAATDRCEIVFARSYQVGTDSDKTPVGSTNLFRIASLSKPITAVAISPLVEPGKIELCTPVFSVLDFKNEVGTKVK